MRRLVNLLALILVSAIAVEVSLRFWIDTSTADPPLALIAAVDVLRGQDRQQRAVRAFTEATGYALPFEELSKLEPRLFDATYAPKNLDLLYELHREYRASFDRLASEVTQMGSALIVLYLPSNWNDSGCMTKIGGTTRRLFERSAERHGAAFVDLHDDIVDLPWEEMTLHPRDSHLSGQANQIIARRLAEVLDRYRGHRVVLKEPEVPDLLGDLRPNVDAVEEWEQGMPFRLITNSQGLRMTEDVSPAKRRQRVLVLGDSFTFGPHLANEDTFPSILAALRPEIEVLNAGHVGYTIIDEADLFIERAQFAAPDVVVVQVLDNDVYGMLAVMRNVFGRRKHVHGEITKGSEAEARVLEGLLGQPPAAP